MTSPYRVVWAFVLAPLLLKWTARRRWRDAELARELRARWQAVAEVETGEEQRASPGERLQRLNAILPVALALGLDLPAGRDDELAVWRRWAHLKDRCK